MQRLGPCPLQTPRPHQASRPGLPPWFILWASASVLACGGAKPAVPSPKTASATKDKEGVTGGPRLIVWLTIDQMRNDFLETYRGHFGEGGFMRLSRLAVQFQNAHFGHAITETAPGHATLFTGLSPREHGIIGNSWLEADGAPVSSVTDKSVRVLGPGVPSEISAKAPGQSPRRLLARTLGDELITQTGSRAKVLAVSSKDRAAILPGGHLGVAYWIEGSGFVTSSYYVRDVSPWVIAHHESHPFEKYLHGGWPLFLAEESYLRPASASRYAPPELGQSFPHSLHAGTDPSRALTNSPFGDTAVIDFALAAIAGENLGADDTVDILALGLSSTDKIGHYFGPESREMEDQIARLDLELARLFTHIDESVGFKNVIFVLSSDHGGCESAEYLQKLGKSGRRLTEAHLEEASRASLKQIYGHDRYFLGVSSPYVFLNRTSIGTDRRELSAVRTALASDIAAVEGVYLAHALGAELPSTPVGQLLREALHEERSGDIYVVPQKHTLFLQEDTLLATHGSPWEYDTHVPLLIYIPGLAPGVVRERVDVRSVVPTLAFAIGVKSPSAFPVLPLGVPESHGSQ